MAKVSIVIPVYNVEEYLRECLDSVRNQSLHDIEIICVDDGSTDSSPQILDEYAKNDPRFQIIHKQNEGYGKAMNIGMDAATSQYVGIVESDDIILPEMFETLYKIIKEENVDVVKADFYQFYQSLEGKYIDEYIPLIQNEEEEGLYNIAFNILEHEEAMLLKKYTWSGIYNLDFIRREGIKHNETPGASYQDNGFWFQTMIKAKKIYFLNHAFYKYRIDNPNSSVNSNGKVFCVCDEYDFVCDILDNMGEEGRPFYKWATYKRIDDCAGNIGRVADEYKMQLALRIKEDFLQAIDNNYVESRLYSNYLKTIIFDIIANPEEFLKKENLRRKKITDIAKSFEIIILYGAGKVGKNVQSQLKEGRVNVMIKYFAVSNKENNPEEVRGIPVREVEELNDYMKDALFIISVGKSMYDEVESKLKSLNCKHYIFAHELWE